MAGMLHGLFCFKEKNGWNAAWHNLLKHLLECCMANFDF
jgi:hypothetical protein